MLDILGKRKGSLLCLSGILLHVTSGKTQKAKFVSGIGTRHPGKPEVPPGSLG